MDSLQNCPTLPEDVRSATGADLDIQSLKCQAVQQESISDARTFQDILDLGSTLDCLVGSKPVGLTQQSISTAELLQQLRKVTELAVDQKSRIDGNDALVEEYMHRVNCSYEEVTFIRWLISQIQLQGLHDNADDLAARIWPELKTIVGAEGVYYLKNTSVEQTGLGVRTPEVCLAAGERQLAEDFLATANDLDSQLVWDRLIVHNSAPQSQVDRGTNPVQSYIIAPVANDAIRLGWILVINKTVDSYFERSARVDEFQPSEVEFGTYEATFVEAVATLLVTQAHNHALFQAQERLLVNTIRTLVNAIDARDPYTRGHSERVATISRLLAEHLQMPHSDCEDIYVSGLLHDIGKIGVPDHVLRKPGRLTDEEFESIKQHPTIGCQILSGIQEFAYVIPGVRHHHEAWDGSGYPDGLSGDAIPLVARILAVADSYDAMTSSRPYRTGMPIEKAEAILRENAGVQWDSTIVDAYFAIREDIHAISEKPSQCSLQLESSISNA